MSDVLSFTQDTPIERACIKDLNADQLEQLVLKMRERRMRQQTLYQEAQAAAKQAKDEKDGLRLEKLFSMYEKKAATADAAIETLSKYVTEMRVLQLTMED